jgi:Protein of unknown function (DUF3376)/Patatin-like phospholipase
VALALNGGVSLAVWMGGCAVELDCARRADVAEEELAYPDIGTGPERGRTRRVYHALCDAFGRRLVLDILSGASAGGVNGALLGAAMKARRRLHPRFVRESWIHLGDFSELLQKTTEEAPRALMQGMLFHEAMVKAFRAVLDESGEGPAPEGWELAAGALPEGQEDLAPLVPKLDVTMTDVRGRSRVFHDEWGGDLVALEHRLRFKFRGEGDYAAAELADAARTSASFPVAFEPWRVEGAAAELAGLAEGETTYGVDGGLLDNAPIRAALDLIPGQPASGEVRRYVCYLNADPPQTTPEAVDEEEPALTDVVGYIVNLPRVAPFVDQLYAVREASRRADLAPHIQRPLLELPLATLRDTAEALLLAYRRRRRLESLDELLAEPAGSRRVARRLAEAGADLPWVPSSLDPRAAADGWEWGTRPAQRILHLLLDLLRPAIVAAPAEATGPLLELRETIGARLVELDGIHRGMTTEPGVLAELEQLAAGAGDPSAAAAALADLTAGPRGEAYGCVLAAAEAFKARLDAEGRPGFLGDLYARLFEEGEPEWSWFERFLARALAVEVVRRAFAAEADFETAQRLRFVQLTPSTPTPILAEDPFKTAKPAEARDKLNGVGLGHFAGFYRRSWRANDFMWGRLDAAARIVEVLLDGVGPADPSGAATTLADAILPGDASEDARWLAHEALEAKLGDSYAGKGATPPPTADLNPLLRDAIGAELAAAPGGAGEDEPTGPTLDRLPLTRAVCIRAIQLEIVEDELPVLVAESAEDRKQGSSSPALELPLAGGTRAAIENLRAGDPLPQRLDDHHEEVSDLGLRTISHAALVGLAAAKGVGAPLAKLFGLARAPVQAISGVVSTHLLYRATVAIAFWAAALYLTMRFATAQPGDTKLSDVWSRSVLLSLVAAPAVLAVVLVPGLRAWRNKVHRGRNLGWAAAFALAGGVLAAVLAATVGDLGVTNVLFGAGAKQLPDWLLTVALVVTVGLGAIRLPIFGKTANSWLAGNRAGWKLCAPLLVVAALVGVFAIWRLAPVFWDSWWQTLSAVVAIAGPAALGLLYLRPNRSPQ